MAELFRAKLTTYKQVINTDDVHQIISVLGAPEDISDNEGPSASEKFSSPGYHRMYRDTDHRVIGGVCSGLGAYWGIDPVIIRVIFVAFILAGGIGALVYLILYIVIPEAKTTAQKIEMKGAPVNIHNIKESVKKEVETVRKNLKI
jgi:phage shock protein PspC (stress-responsive transcriptional regulator)